MCGLLPPLFCGACEPAGGASGGGGTAGEPLPPPPDLFGTLSAALDADTAVDEMAIVPDLPGGAEFMVVDHKLALLRAAGAGLFAAGRALMDELRGAAAGAGSVDETRLHHATRAVLLVNANHYTAWNLRKRWLLQPGW